MALKRPRSLLQPSSRFYTITSGSVAETGPGMEHVFARGHTADVPPGGGLNRVDLEAGAGRAEAAGFRAHVLHLEELGAVGLPAGCPPLPQATLLVIPGGVEMVQPGLTHALFQENQRLPYDTKALMRGVVKNKRARANAVFADYSQPPDYAAGKGSVFDFAALPALSAWRAGIERVLGEKVAGLPAEGNRYDGEDKQGIGFHGDSERRIVVACRVGNTSGGLPLHYQWYWRGEPVGRRIAVTLHSGDLYAMCEKATGKDWKKKVCPTLRHAAGHSSYLRLEEVRGDVFSLVTPAPELRVPRGGAGGPAHAPLPAPPAPSTSSTLAPSAAAPDETRA